MKKTYWLVKKARKKVKKLEKNKAQSNIYKYLQKIVVTKCSPYLAFLFTDTHPRLINLVL